MVRGCPAAAPIIMGATAIMAAPFSRARLPARAARSDPERSAVGRVTSSILLAPNVACAA